MAQTVKLFQGIDAHTIFVSIHLLLVLVFLCDLFTITKIAFYFANL